MRLEKAISDDINALRGLAALGVIWAHTMGRVQPPVTVNGAFWVWVFFATSGYLQGSSFASGRYSLDRSGAIRFWKNRARRILPLFWLVLSLALFLRFSLGGGDISRGAVLRQYVALTTDYDLLGPLWSIAAEIHLYILAPFLCALLAPPKHRFARYILLGLGLAGLLVAMWLGDSSGEPRSGLGNALIFITGVMAAYRVKPYFKLRQRWRGMLFVAVILAAGILEHNFGGFFWTLKAGAMLAVVTAYLVFDNPPLAEVPRSYALFRSPLIVVGRYCYGVYVYSALIGVVATQVFHVGYGFELLAVELLGIPVAFASFRIFERHFSVSGLPGMAKDSIQAPVAPPVRCDQNLMPGDAAAAIARTS